MDEGLDVALHEDVAQFHLAVFILREELGLAGVFHLDDVVAAGLCTGVLAISPFLRPAMAVLRPPV